MNEWMNEQTNERANERTNEQTNKWTNAGVINIGCALTGWTGLDLYISFFKRNSTACYPYSNNKHFYTDVAVLGWMYIDTDVAVLEWL